MTVSAARKGDPSLSRVTADLSRLADWYQQNKPSVRLMRMAPDAWRRLKTANKDSLRVAGIRPTTAGFFTFRGFRLRPLIAEGGGMRAAASSVTSRSEA